MVIGILAGAVVVLAVLLGVSLTRETKTQKTLKTLQLEQRGWNVRDEKDKCLDYLFKFYQLSIADPYMVKPGYDEKRCYHCHHKAGHGHDPQCPWAVVQPLINRLYAPPRQAPETLL